MTLFRFSGLRGRTLFSAAVYRGPRGPVLFLWYGRRVASWLLSLFLAWLAAVVTVAGCAVVLVQLDRIAGLFR